MSERKPRVQQNYAKQFTLTCYVRDHYVASKLNDMDFAEKAAKELDFPVGAPNVVSARKSVGLPSNWRKTPKEKPEVDPNDKLMLVEMRLLRAEIKELSGTLEKFIAAMRPS